MEGGDKKANEKKEIKEKEGQFSKRALTSVVLT